MLRSRYVATCVTMALTFKVALQSLEDVTQLVQCQVAAGMKAPDIISAKFASYSHRFESLQTVTSQQIAELTKASNEGPWTSEQKLAFARMFDEKGEIVANKYGKKARTRSVSRSRTIFQKINGLN